MQKCKPLYIATSRFLYDPGQVTVNDLTLLHEQLPEYSMAFFLHHLGDQLESEVLKKPLDELTLQEALVRTKLTGEESVDALCTKMKAQRYHRLGGWKTGRMNLMDLYLKSKEEGTSLDKVFFDVHPDGWE